MRRLSSSPWRWRPLLYSVASAPHRRWQSELVRRGAPRIAAPGPPAHRVSRFPHGTRNMASSSGGYELTSDDKESCAADPTDDDVVLEEIFPDSSHRDGSIYSVPYRWKKEYRIADRNEMKLANIPVEHGPVELYGYIAARDNLDRLLNYVINVSRDDPIILEQGSLIDMAGPKRGIQLIDTILIEYDMKIKTGQNEKEDLQLIDGVSLVDDIDAWNCSLFTHRMNGGNGGFDITAARLDSAVEATVEVTISQVQGGLSMRLDCFTSGLHKEIRLFDGVIVESGGLKRSVVAVVMDAQMDLKFKVAAGSCIPAEHCCSFTATKHGCATREIKTDFALIAVKVTWSTLD